MEKTGSEMLRTAALAGDLESVKEALGLPDCDINERNDDDGETALHSACRQGFPHIVKYLIEAGVDIEVNGLIYSEVEEEGENTALSEALANSNDECAILLLEQHAQCDTFDWRGMSPLFLTVLNDNKKMFGLVLRELAPELDGHEHFFDHFASMRKNNGNKTFRNATETSIAMQHLVEKLRSSQKLSNAMAKPTKSPPPAL